MKEIDYVELFAGKIREDNSLFQQQKALIEAQIKGSSSLFRNMFNKNFKAQAREYLKKVDLLQ